MKVYPQIRCYLKTSKIILMVRTFWWLAPHKKRVSSANWSISTSISFFLIFRPWSCFTFTAYLTNLVNPFATIRKRKGAMRSPYLNPLYGKNFVVRLSFTKIDTEVNFIQPLIQAIHFSLTLFCSSCNTPTSYWVVDLLIVNIYYYPITHMPVNVF